MDKTEELRQWFSIADTDLVTAEYLFKTMHPTPDEIICFHCQQAAEKYLKGYLFLHGIEPPKMHALPQLLQMCESLQANFSTLLPQCSFLNRFSVIHRYPNEIEITDADVRMTLQYANVIKAFVVAEANSANNDSAAENNGKEVPPHA
jgi:HEPN domain-containing protein